MNKKEIQRLGLYEIFSKNLDSIKKETFIQLEPDIPNSYICPLCIRCFGKNALDQVHPNCLTLEDVPPKKLGGKPFTLTCKKCNNTTGSLLDAQLNKKIVGDEFHSGFPKAVIDAKLQLNNDLCISATLSNREGGGLNFHMFKNGPNAKKNKGKSIPRVRNHIKKNGIQKFNCNLQFHKKNHPEIALLRVAYLLAFSTFGNGFLFNSNLEIIREQIKKPKEEILPNFGVINADFSDFHSGIYIINKPLELRSYLVIFELKTTNRTTKHGVMLPGPSTPNISIYNFAKKISSNQNIQFTATPIPEQNYLQNQDLKFASTWYWDNGVYEKKNVYRDRDAHY